MSGKRSPSNKTAKPNSKLPNDQLQFSENNRSTSTDTDTIRDLQQHAEAAQLEREAVERQLRLEIDALKSKAARSAMGLVRVYVSTCLSVCLDSSLKGYIFVLML